jgi:hypothetical protein
MSLLLGALGGLGAGLSGVADNRIQNIDQRSLAQMQESLAIAKERRVEEMQKRQEQRGEESTIRAEGRALSNADLARKSQFDFETNPENVQKRTAAELSQLQAKDDYRYSNQAREAAYQGAMSEAKYGPMYEARAANATSRAASGAGKIPEAVKLRVKNMIARADDLRKSAEGLDEEERIGALMEAKRLEQQADEMLTSYDPTAPLAGEMGAPSNDPLGLRSQENPEEKAKLMQQLKDSGATLDFQQVPDTATLKAMLADMQTAKPSDKVSEKLGGKGLLGQSRAQILDEINKLTNGNFDIPADAPTPELAKMLQQLRKDASEQSKRDAKQKAAADEKAKSRAEKEAKDMKRMEGLLNYKPKYFGQRDSGM